MYTLYQLSHYTQINIVILQHILCLLQNTHNMNTSLEY